MVMRLCPPVKGLKQFQQITILLCVDGMGNGFLDATTFDDGFGYILIIISENVHIAILIIDIDTFRFKNIKLLLWIEC